MAWRLLGSVRGPGVAALGWPEARRDGPGRGGGPSGLEQEEGFPGSPYGFTSHVVSLREPEGAWGEDQVGNPLRLHTRNCFPWQETHWGEALRVSQMWKMLLSEGEPPGARSPELYEPFRTGTCGQGHADLCSCHLGGSPRRLS